MSEYREKEMSSNVVSCLPNSQIKFIVAQDKGRQNMFTSIIMICCDDILLSDNKHCRSYTFLGAIFSYSWPLICMRVGCYTKTSKFIVIN